jgi:4'-phosphopantetheinyl transferase
MYLSLIKTDSPEMKALLRDYVGIIDYTNLSTRRPTQMTRRACALALARDLLVINGFLLVDDAKHIVIQHYESGEPYLEFAKGSRFPLHISISHSKAWIACLISHADQPAGIDLEHLDANRNFLELARHFFSTIEFDYVKQHGPEAFYKLWTAKEAIAKLHGKGLSEALKILIDPSSFAKGTQSIKGRNYSLTQKHFQDYIYTIARTLV